MFHEVSYIAVDSFTNTLLNRFAMAFSIGFTLGNPRKTGRLPVRCRIIINSIPAYFNTEFEVSKPEQFLKKEGKFKRNSKGNLELDKIKVDVGEVYREIKHRQPSAKEVKEAYLNWGKSKKTISQAIETFLEEKERNPDITTSTLRMYKIRLQLFKSFLVGNRLEEKEASLMRLDNIRDFEVYLRDYRKRDGKPLGNRKAVHEAVRIFFNYAQSRDMIETNPYQRFTMPKQAPSDQKKFLNLRELNRLLLSTRQELGETLYETRCQFLLSVCLGGLSFVDLQSLAPAEVKEDRGRLWMERRRQKTQTPLYTPFSPLATSLYNGLLEEGKNLQLPKSNIYYNRQLALLMEAVGVDKKITSHCSRTTLANNMTMLGIGDHIIQSLMGHVPNTMLGKHYRHIPDKAKINAVDTLEQAIRNPEEWE